MYTKYVQWTPGEEKKHPTGERAIEKFGRESGRGPPSPAPATERAHIRTEILLPPHGRAHRVREIRQFLAGEMLQVFCDKVWHVWYQNV